MTTNSFNRGRSEAIEEICKLNKAEDDIFKQIDDIVDYKKLTEELTGATYYKNLVEFEPGVYRLLDALQIEALRLNIKLGKVPNYDKIKLFETDSPDSKYIKFNEKGNIIPGTCTFISSKNCSFNIFETMLVDFFFRE